MNIGLIESNEVHKEHFLIRILTALEGLLLKGSFASGSTHGPSMLQNYFGHNNTSSVSL